MHIGGYRMVPQLIARVDGLPVSLLDREVVWPPPAEDGCARVRETLSAKRRARIERQTAVVHECRLPAWSQAMIAEQTAESERLAIHAELVAAGLL
jgi:hypothetical protein